MSRAEFLEGADRLWSWVDNLWRKTRAHRREFAAQLRRQRRRPPGALPPRLVVALCLKEIGDRIEEVMTTYDLLCTAAGRAPWFELAFQVMDAPDVVQERVRKCLAQGAYPILPARPRPGERRRAS
jgi:hypothetical protein